MDVWQQVKLHYIGLLTNHHQPELAETFFNSVTTKILHRSYFHNDFIFVRPAVSHRVHRERRAGRRCRPTAPTTRRKDDAARDAGCASSTTSSSQREFEDLGRDVDHVLAAVIARARRLPPARELPDPGAVARCSSATRAPTWSARSSTASPRCRSRCRSCTTPRGQLVIDTALFGEDDLLLLFSFARAYFMVDMEMPVGLRAVPALDDAAQAARASSTTRSACRSRARTSSTATSSTTCATAATVPHRARHQGHGDAGVRPAVASPTSSRSSRTSTRRRRTPRAS